MSWVNVGIAAAGAATSIYGANQAASATEKGSKNALGLQTQQYNNAMQMLEPQRYLGYQAMDDLSRLYGYGMSGYQPVNMLMGGAGGGGFNVKANTNNASLGKGLLADAAGGPLGAGLAFGSKDNNPFSYFGGSKPNQYGGAINALAGTVDVKGAGQKKDALLTDYLRTGVWSGGKGGRTTKLRSAIDALREQGYAYGEGGGTMPGSVAARPAGEPGDMSRFFASPDYNFRRDEGIRGIEQGAAARGGALSGNALRGVTDFSSNLASGEYGNYVNRLFNMAGMGQTATGSAIGAGGSYANNAGQLQQNIGDSRASGVLGTTNAIGQAGQNYLMWDWLRKQNSTGGAAPQNSPYGPWAGGYQFPRGG